MARPTICIGCGLKVTFDGVLELSGPRTTRQDGVTPMEWPYNGSVADDEFPDTGVPGLALGNGLFFDYSDEASGVCRIAAFPNATARVEQDNVTPIGGGPFGNSYVWSIQDGAFDAPWNDTGVQFTLADWVEITLDNPSINRPMIVAYTFDIGGVYAVLDDLTWLTIFAEFKIWDDPAGAEVPGVEPVTGDSALVAYFRGDSGTPGNLSTQMVSPTHIELNRKNGPLVGTFPELATYLPPQVPAAVGGPDSTTHWKCRLVATMGAGTATVVPGQFVSLDRTPEMMIRAVTV